MLRRREKTNRNAEPELILREFRMTETMRRYAIQTGKSSGSCCLDNQRNANRFEGEKIALSIFVKRLRIMNEYSQHDS